MHIWCVPSKNREMLFLKKFHFTRKISMHAWTFLNFETSTSTFLLLLAHKSTVKLWLDDPGLVPGGNICKLSVSESGLCQRTHISAPGSRNELFISTLSYYKIEKWSHSRISHSSMSGMFIQVTQATPTWPLHWMSDLPLTVVWHHKNVSTIYVLLMLNKVWCFWHVYPSSLSVLS